MKKDGFTLVELMAVIAIIAVLSVIIIPSLVTVNKNINSRLYNQKVDNIESAAELYASNHPDIFNGSDRAYVTVNQLIEANYLEIDTKASNDNSVICNTTKYASGCITDPRAETDSGQEITPENSVLNEKYILIVKKNVGVTATLVEDTEEQETSNATLVKLLCDEFRKNENDNPKFLGFAQIANDQIVPCQCNSDESDIVQKANTSQSVNACIIVSNKPAGDVDNWLKYGSTQANWRVLGLYKVNGQIYPKIITSDVVQ